MKATIVDDIDKTTEPGAIEIRYYPEAAGDEAGKIAGLASNCPGCGKPGWVPLKQKKQSEYDWQLVQLEPLTIHPSVNCVGCCGWHGWLKNGEWISV